VPITRGQKPQKVRVLVVDDSAVVRAILRNALSQHPDIEVVGQAADGLDALTKIPALRPDVVTLDVEMPRLDGIGVLERVGGRLPVSFLMVSTLTQAGAQVTFDALERGAFDYIPKPHAGHMVSQAEFREMLHAKVLAAARAKGRARRLAAGPPPAARRLPPNQVRGWVVAIGISCGGPQTLMEMLPVFPSDFVPILVTQHMPPQFTPSFAQHLGQACAMRVVHASDGQPVAHGTIYIAPGDRHLRLRRSGIDLRIALDAGEKVSGHRPSVDAMFFSAAHTCAPRCVGVIMTGMGHDGAEGIVRLHQAGCPTIAQDEQTSLVYGMPKAAVATGCVHHVVPLDEIPQTIARIIRSESRVARPEAEVV